MGESNYQDYIEAKLFDDDSLDHNQSEIVSQIDSSCLNYRHTANPKLGCPKDGVNGRQVKSNINLRNDRDRYEERVSVPRVSQERYLVEEDEVGHMDAQIDQECSERSIAIDEFPEDNEVNEEIINTFPNKIFSKVLAVYAQDYCLFRTPVLEKLSNGIIISRRAKLTKGNLKINKASVQGRQSSVQSLFMRNKRLRSVGQPSSHMDSSND